MIQNKIDELRENDDFELNMVNEDNEWLRAVQRFFNSSTIEERITAMLSAQYVRLGTMVKVAYNGFDETEDMPYNPVPVMDIMTASIQNELDDNYRRVMIVAEELFLNQDVDTVEGIKNVLAEIKREDEETEARDEAFEKKVSKASKS